jgi:hypothetical protein
MNIVTAVSRPNNLPRIADSISSARGNHGIDVRWLLVLDAPGTLPATVAAALDVHKDIEIDFLIHHGGPCRYGIAQKNLGISQIREGWFYLLDDDNIVHPNLFRGIVAARMPHPSKKAIAFSQKRWDSESKIAHPDRMRPAQIDNSMFVIHKDLIGARRYNLKRAGLEDFYFFKDIYDTYPDEFIFLPEFLAYYNYLRVFPNDVHSNLGEVPGLR